MKKIYLLILLILIIIPNKILLAETNDPVDITENRELLIANNYQNLLFSIKTNRDADRLKLSNKYLEKGLTNLFNESGINIKYIDVNKANNENNNVVEYAEMKVTLTDWSYHIQLSYKRTLCLLQLSNSDINSKDNKIISNCIAAPAIVWQEGFLGGHRNRNSPIKETINKLSRLFINEYIKINKKN